MAWVQVLGDYRINGAGEGMTFSQVMDCLGEAEIIKDWWDVPQHVTYSIEYFIRKCKYEFMSFELDGVTALTIYWHKSRPRTDYIKMLLDMTKEEVMDRFGISYYYEYAIGEEYELIDTGIDEYKGYYFEKSGFTFAFEDNESVAFIIVSEINELSGVYAGMDFSQVQNCLGVTEIIESYNEALARKEYCINYVIDGCIYTFMSFQQNGSDSTLLVTKEDKKA